MVDRERQASEPTEVEVTPEMIEAGVDELLSHDIYPDVHHAGPSMEVWRSAVRDTFKAMLKGHSSPQF